MKGSTSMGLIEIQGYPDGSDITLLDCYYIRPMKMPDGKWTDDMIVLLFMDNRDRSKHHAIIPKPKYQFYEIKGIHLCNTRFLKFANVGI